MSQRASFSVDDLIAATGGELLLHRHSTGASGLCEYAGRVGPRDVFIAIARDQYVMGGTIAGEDSHDQLIRVLERRCRRLIIDRQHYGDATWREKFEREILASHELDYVLLVDHTTEAYYDLAAFVRSAINPTVVAVTGSVGKTSTTEMVACILAERAATLKSNVWNSHVAVSRALLNMPLDTQYAAVEVSTRRHGLIERVSKITQPNVAIITQVQHEHLKGLGSLEGIAREKCSITSHMPSDGTLIVPESKYVREALKWPGRTIWIDPTALETRSHDESGNTFQYKGVEYRLNVPGRHYAVNALSAIEAALSLGLTVEQIVAGLLKFRLAGNRWNVQQFDREVVIINDCPNNPSPVTTRAAIETLVATYPTHRKIIVLSDSLELGKYEQELLEDLARFIDQHPIDEVVTFGEKAAITAKCLRRPGLRVTRFDEPLAEPRQFTADSEGLQFLYSRLGPRTVLLVKASRVMGFDRIAPLLAERIESDGLPPSPKPLPSSIAELAPSGETTGAPSTCRTDDFLDAIRQHLTRDTAAGLLDEGTEPILQATSLPKTFWGCAVTLYQPGHERIVVVRAMQERPFENVRQAANRVLKHERFAAFDVADRWKCRIHVDFILEEPQTIEWTSLSDAVLPDEWTTNRSDQTKPTAIAPGVASSSEQQLRPDPGADGSLAAESPLIGMPWQVQVLDWMEAANTRQVERVESTRKLTRFELGVDGLRIMGGSKRRHFLPGDAFVKSIFGISQLRRHVQRLFPGEDINKLEYQRFRALSFVSGVVPGSWLPLYRGLPPVPEVNDASLTQAARAGTKWIADSLQADGRFIYYYDAATGTGRDHEHPTRDPVTDPYYNLLRHGGGVITLLLEEQLSLAHRLAQRGRESLSAECVSEGEVSGRKRFPTLSTIAPSTSAEQRRNVIEKSTTFFVDQLVNYETADGEQAAFALYNRKAKLGGSGIGLCLLAMYQHTFQDERYAGSAERLANHLVSEINGQGEFRYYHVYLDKPVLWAENQRYFSFYYPGEAILGLSQYCQHVCKSDETRQQVFAKIHQALRFLLRDRPHLHKEHYQSLPSDSWLMMGINDLWDVAEFQQDEYSKFVFDDADQMVRLMYTEEDALYPDYVGSFYYRYGDHPYPDGARAEGLLAAYQLALKVGDRERIESYRAACYKAAAATLRLCNTPESVYSAANPARAVGGIRFKLTRQWFRVDTIQHVASFYLKLLATESA